MPNLQDCKPSPESPIVLQQLDLRISKHENVPSEPNIIAEEKEIGKDRHEITREADNDQIRNHEDDISALLQELHDRNEKLSDHFSELQQIIESPAPQQKDDCTVTQQEQEAQVALQREPGDKQQQQNNSNYSCSSVPEKKLKKNPKLTVRVAEPNPQPSQVRQCSPPLASPTYNGACNSNGKSPDVSLAIPSFSPFRDKCTLHSSAPAAISPYRTSVSQSTPPFSRQPTPPFQFEKEGVLVDFSRDQVETLLNETMARMKTQLNALSSIEEEGISHTVALGSSEPLPAKRKLFTA